MTRKEINEHYGMLNKRFDERAAYLRAHGFTYHSIPDLSIGYFGRQQRGRKLETIQTGTVMNADDIVWADYVCRIAE